MALSLREQWAQDKKMEQYKEQYKGYRKHLQILQWYAALNKSIGLSK